MEPSTGPEGVADGHERPYERLPVIARRHPERQVALAQHRAQYGTSGT